MNENILLGIKFKKIGYQDLIIKLVNDKYITAFFLLKRRKL